MPRYAAAGLALRSSYTGYEEWSLSHGMCPACGARWDRIVTRLQRRGVEHSAVEHSAPSSTARHRAQRAVDHSAPSTPHPNRIIGRTQVNRCDLAEGPFPQGTGCLTCLSAPLAKLLAQSGDFRHFVDVARARNDLGRPCRSRVACAAASTPRRMWHHEDAGISYNVWRTALAHRLRAAIVHLPGGRQHPNPRPVACPACPERARCERWRREHQHCHRHCHHHHDSHRRASTASVAASARRL